MPDTSFTIGVNGEDNLSAAAVSATRSLQELNTSATAVADGLSAGTEALNRISTEAASVASAFATTTGAFTDLNTVAGELAARFAESGAALERMTAQAEGAGEAFSMLTERLASVGEGAAAASEGMSKAGEGARTAGEHAEEAEGMFSKFGESLKEIGSLAAGFVIGSAVISAVSDLTSNFEHGIESANELGEAVHQLMLTTGGSAEELSGMVAAMERLGVGSDQATASLDRFAKNLNLVEQSTDKQLQVTTGAVGALKELGFNVDALHDKMPPLNDVLLMVADQFSKLPDGTEKTAIAMQLFGKAAGPDLIQFLNQGSAGIKEAEETAAKYGLTLSTENVEQVHAFGLAHKDLDEAVQGVTVQIGLALMPALTAASEAVRDGARAFNENILPAIRSFIEEAGPPVHAVLDAIGSGFQTVLQFIQPLTTALSSFVELGKSTFEGLGSAAEQALGGDLSGALATAAQTLLNWGIGLVQDTAEWESALINWVLDVTPQLLQRLGDLLGALGDWIGGTAAPYIEDHMQEWVDRFTDWSGEVSSPLLSRLGTVLGDLGTWITDYAAPFIASHLEGWVEAYWEWVQKVDGPLLSALGSLLENLGGWIVGTALPALEADVLQWGQAFIGWVGPTVGPMLASLGDLEQQLQDWVGSTALPAITDAVGQWGQAFIDWVGPNIGPMLGELNKLSVALVEWILLTAMPDLIEKLAQWGIQFTQWVIDAAPKVIAELVKLQVQMLQWIADQVPALIDQLAYWAGAFTKWVEDAAQSVVAELDNFIQQIQQWVSGDGLTGVTQAGGDLANGILQGFKDALTSGIPDLLSNLGNLGQAIVDKIKGVFSGAADSYSAGFSGSAPAGGGNGVDVPSGAAFGPTPVPGANAGMGVPAPGDTAGWAQWLVNSGAIPEGLLSDPNFLQILLIGGSAESGLNAGRVQDGTKLGSGVGGRGLFQFDMGGMGAGLSENFLTSDAGAQYEAQQIIPQYAANYQANLAKGLSGEQLALQTIGQSEKPLGYNSATNSLEPGSPGYNNYQRAYNQLGGLPGDSAATQQATDASKAATEAAGDAAKSSTDLTNAYIGTSAAAADTKKTLADELQPTMEQFNKLLRDSQDQLDKINSSEAQSLAANTAKFGPGGTADQAVNAAADQQIAQLEANAQIQADSQARQQALAAQIASETQAHQYADQVANTQFSRGQSADELQHSRAEEDANNAAQAQINAADLAHNRQVEDADDTYKHSQDLARAQTSLQEALANATTAAQRKSAQDSYAQRVQSINDAYTYQQQDLAHQRADQDAQIKYQADEQAKALATKRQQQDADLAYTNKQQDAASAHAREMQQADQQFAADEAKKQSDLQKQLAQEALDRQIASINAQRDAKIKADAADLVANQAAIQAKADQDRTALAKQVQERTDDLVQQAKDRATAMKASADALQPFLDTMTAGLNAFLATLGAANTAAITSVGDTATSISNTIAAALGDGGTVPDSIDVSDQSVELFADKFKLSWDDARQVLSAIEGGVKDTMGTVVPHQVNISDQAVEAFANQWKISWNDARAILETGSTEATKALGKDIPDSVTQTVDAMNTAKTPIQGLTDALNAIPANVSTTVTTNFVSNGSGGGSSSSTNHYAGQGTAGQYTLPNIVTGGKITVSGDNLQDAINNAAKQTGVTPSQQAGGGTFGSNSNPSLSFDDGGWVPGPIGAPVSATVHGGEYVIPTSAMHGGGGIDEDRLAGKIAIALAAALAANPPVVSMDGQKVTAVVRSNLIQTARSVGGADKLFSR